MIIAILVLAIYVNAVDVIGSFREFGLLDLQVYRMGGQAILDGTPLYESRYFHDALPFTYPPFSAVAFTGFTLLGWTGSAILMTLLSLAALIRGCTLVAATLEVSARARRFVFGGPALVMVAMGLASWPLRSTFEYGQVNLLVMWLVLEDLLGWGRRGKWQGTLIGLAVGIKVTPFVFVVFLLVSRQRRQAIVATATFLITVALGVGLQPSSAWSYWTAALFDSSRVGNPTYVANQSLNGLFQRSWGPSTAVSMLWLVLSVGIVVATMAMARRLWASGDAAPAIVAVALSALLVSPISWTHHWVWLALVPCVLVHLSRHAAPARRAGAAIVATLVTVTSLIRPMTVFPDAPAHSPIIQLAASGYVVVAGLTLATLATLIWSSRSGEIVPGPGPGPARTRSPACLPVGAPRATSGPGHSTTTAT